MRRSTGRRSLALLGALSLALAVAPAMSGGQAKSRPTAKVGNDYDAYLQDHLKLEPRMRGARIMAEKAQIPASLIARKQEQRARAAAEEPCDSTDKPVGCQATFWVHNFKANQDYEAVFVLAAKGPHSYIWVDVTAYDPTGATTADPNGTVTAEEAQLAADRFESVWEIDRAYFGHEANPNEKPYRTPPRLPDNWRDADGDEHINIVNFPIDTGASYVAGYYSAAAGVVFLGVLPDALLAIAERSAAGLLQIPPGLTRLGL